MVRDLNINRCIRKINLNSARHVLEIKMTKKKYIYYILFERIEPNSLLLIYNAIKLKWEKWKLSKSHK